MSRKSKKIAAPQSGAKKASPAAQSASKLLWAARLCLAGAAGVAAYLLWYSITKKPMAGCGPGSPCDRVLGSPWAYWLGLPVSAPAVVAYLALLVSSFAVAGKNQPKIANAWRVIFFVGVAAVASAIWFSILQVSVLKSICKFCTSTHLLGFCGVILLLSQAPLPILPRSQISILKPRDLVAPVLLGLLCFGVLAGGQKIAPRKMNVVGVYQGAFSFDLREVPLIGSATDPHYIVSLFDYTCPDCHEMHNQLLAARQRLNNSFCIISLPIPLDPRCNYLVRTARPKHAQACDYARLGLALRHSSLESFQKYDHWFFSLPATPPLDQARQEAISIIGQAELDKNLADPWLNKMIEKSVSIYAKNETVTHSMRIPQLIIGDVVNAGPVRSVDDLVTLLKANLSKATL